MSFRVHPAVWLLFVATTLSGCGTSNKPATQNTDALKVELQDALNDDEDYVAKGQAVTLAANVDSKPPPKPVAPRQGMRWGSQLPKNPAIQWTEPTASIAELFSRDDYGPPPETQSSAETATRLRDRVGGYHVYAEQDGPYAVVMLPKKRAKCVSLRNSDPVHSFGAMIEAPYHKLTRLSPDGSHLAVMRNSDDQKSCFIELWQAGDDATSTRTPTRLMLQNPAHYWTFLDGQRLLLIRHDPFPVVEIYDAENAELTASWQLAPKDRDPLMQYTYKMGQIGQSLKITPEAKFFSSGTLIKYGDRSPGLYDLGSNRLFFVWEGQACWVNLEPDASIRWTRLEMPKNAQMLGGDWSIGFDPKLGELIVGAFGKAIFLIRNLETSQPAVDAFTASYGPAAKRTGHPTTFVGRFVKLPINDLWTLQLTRGDRQLPATVVHARSGHNVAFHTPMIRPNDSDPIILGYQRSHKTRFRPFLSLVPDWGLYDSPGVPKGLPAAIRRVGVRVAGDELSLLPASPATSTHPEATLKLRSDKRQRDFLPIRGAESLARVARVPKVTRTEPHDDGSDATAASNIHTAPDAQTVPPDDCKTNSHRRIRFLRYRPNLDPVMVYGAEPLYPSVDETLRGSVVDQTVTAAGASHVAKNSQSRTIFPEVRFENLNKVQIEDWYFPMRPLAAASCDGSLLAITNPMTLHRQLHIETSNGDHRKQLDTRQLFPRGEPGHDRPFEWLGFRRGEANEYEANHDELWMIFNGRLFVCEIRTGEDGLKIVPQWDLIGDYAGTGTFTPDRTRLIVQSRGHLDLIDTTEKRILNRFTFPTSDRITDPEAIDIEVSADGQSLAAIVSSRLSDRLRRYRGMIPFQESQPDVVVWEWDEQGQLERTWQISGASQPDPPQFNTPGPMELAPKPVAPKSDGYDRGWSRVSWVSDRTLMLLGRHPRFVVLRGAGLMFDTPPLNRLEHPDGVAARRLGAIKQSRFLRELDGQLWDDHQPIQWSRSADSTLRALGSGGKIVLLHEIPIEITADVRSPEGSMHRISQIKNDLLQRGYRLGPGGVQMQVTGKYWPSQFVIELESKNPLLQRLISPQEPERVTVDDLLLDWQLSTNGQTVWSARQTIPWSISNTAFQDGQGNLKFPSDDSIRILIAIRDEIALTCGTAKLPDDRPLPMFWIQHPDGSYHLLGDIKYGHQ